MINNFNLDKCGFFKPGLHIYPTDFNLFIGPNGSGKTRLLRNIHKNTTQQLQQEQQQEIQTLQSNLIQKQQKLHREQQQEIRQLQQEQQQEIRLLQLEHRRKVQELQKLQQVEKLQQLQEQQRMEQQQLQKGLQNEQRRIQVLHEQELQQLILDQQQKQQRQKLNIFPVLIDESRFYDGKLEYVKGRVELNNIANTTNIAAKTSEKNQLNDDLFHLFKRNVEIITNTEGQQAPHFTKINGDVLTKDVLTKDVLTKDDGRGIVNVWTVFEYLAFAPDKLPLFVEELSIGLHPSILKKYLDRLFKRLHSKTMQLFATTQDPFTVFYFLKNKLDENLEWNDSNPKYSVFNLSENDGLLSVEKITKENIFSSIDSLMGGFSHSDDIMKFSSLFTGNSSQV